jgi:hypothetical protein
MILVCGPQNAVTASDLLAKKPVLRILSFILMVAHALATEPGPPPRWASSDFQTALVLGGDTAPGSVVTRGSRLTLVPILAQFAIDKQSAYDLTYSITVTAGDQVVFRVDGLKAQGVLSRREIQRFGLTPEGVAWDVPVACEPGVYHVTIEAYDRVGKKSAKRSYDAVVRKG